MAQYLTHLTVVWALSNKRQQAIELLAQNMIQENASNNQAGFYKSREEQLQKIEQELTQCKENLSKATTSFKDAESEFKQYQLDLQTLLNKHKEQMESLEKDEFSELKETVLEEEKAAFLRSMDTEKNQLQTKINDIKTKQSGWDQKIKSLDTQVKDAEATCTGIYKRWNNLDETLYQKNYVLDCAYVLGFMPPDKQGHRELFTIEHNGKAILLLYPDAVVIDSTPTIVTNRIFTYVKQIIFNELFCNKLQLLRFHVVDTESNGNYFKNDHNLFDLVKGKILYIYESTSMAINKLKKLSTAKEDEHMNNIVNANKLCYENGDPPVPYDILILYNCPDVMKNQEMFSIYNNCTQWGFLPIFIMKADVLQSDEAYRDLLIEIDKNDLAYKLNVEKELPEHMSIDYSLIFKPTTLSPIIEEYRLMSQKKNKL